MNAQRTFVLLATLLLVAGLLAFPAPARAVATCLTDADCAAAQFCASQTGKCGDRGVCTDRPEVCFNIYDPVCGCNGQTYSNSCYAAMAGVSVAAPGACGTQTCNKNNDCAEGFYCLQEQGVCGATGTCTLKPEACILIYAPVCGCDGKTYGNSCLAANAGVSVASVGPCPERHCATNDDCAFGTFCLKKAGNCGGNGRCETVPQFCTEIYDPVCGCDGQIYGNSCFAAMAGVSVANPGDVCTGVR